MKTMNRNSVIELSWEELRLISGGDCEAPGTAGSGSCGTGGGGEGYADSGSLGIGGYGAQGGDGTSYMSEAELKILNQGP